MERVVQPPEIFDRRRRIALRERAKQRGNTSFMLTLIAEELADRLLDVKRDFGDVLILGPMASFANMILGNRKANVTLGDEVQEDHLPFAPESFDLIISAGTLDSVNDLPGALLQMRRCLRPDGLFLGHMFGAGTLATLKSAMLAAHWGGVVPHIHPQVDLRSAADLISRVGFALPVVDGDMVTVRYSDWQRLVGDLRDMGIGNALASARQYLGRDYIDLLDAAWRTREDEEGKVDESFAHIYMSGWSPSADQPKPAKRGSGKISLTSVFPQMQSPD